MNQDIFHRDMNTDVRRLWWRKMMIAAVLLVLGGAGARMHAVDYKFVIINNKGKAAFNYTCSNITTLQVDLKAKSIFAENFRFYTSEANAISDAGGSPGTLGTDYFAEGTTIGSGTGDYTGTFYVRYDAKSIRVGNNSSTKYLIRCRNRSGEWWYIYFDKDDSKLKMTTLLEGETDNINKYFWQFNDGGDPYDVYITSDFADETVSGGTVSVAGVSTSNKTPYVTYQAKVADASYDQSVTSNFTMQSFFFTQGTSSSPYKYGNGWSSIWSNSYHLVGAYNGITYRYRDGYNTGWEDKMPYYLCANGDPTKSGAMSNGYQWHCFRSWRAEDTNSGNVSQIQVVSDFAIFHVVNKSGNIAISKLEESPSSTLTIPEEIKSPYIASGNYKFFNTKEEAAAYSSATTDDERTAAAATAITTLDAVTNSTVYAGYYYDPSAKPSDLPALNGSTWYRILNRYNNADNYFYSKLNNNGRADNSSICNSTTNMTGSFTDDYHLWKLTGDDPYAIYLSNKWMNKNKGNGSDLPIRYGGVAQGWFRQMAGYYTMGYTMMLLQYDATYVNMAVVSTNYELSFYEYLYFLGANGTDGSANVQFMRNQNLTSSIYKTDRTAALLKFIEIPTFNYHVTTPSGKELTWQASYDLSTVTNIPMPTELSRKYISSYKYYSDAARTNEITTCEQVLANCTKGEDGYDIYVKYTVDTNAMPFTISTDYAHAKWYRIKVVEGDVYAHQSETAQVAGSDDTYTLDYQYAFFGDPYELKVANRAGGEGKFLGVPAGSTSQEPILPIANGTALNTWEILPQSEAPTVETAADFRLRVFNTATAATPMYCGFYNGKACYFTSAITMAVSALPEHKYTYHIIDNTGREAIHATVMQEITSSITFENLPTSIASPYIANETITAYLTARPASSLYGRTTYNLSAPTQETPVPTAEELAKAEAEKTPTDIYIRYTTDHLADKPLNLDGTRSYNVLQTRSNKYLYAADEATVGYTAHDADGIADQLRQKTYVWVLTGDDPYAVLTQSVEYSTKYFKVTITPGPPPTVTTALSTPDASTYSILLTSETHPTDESYVKLVQAGESALTDGEELKYETGNLGTAHYYIIDKQHKVVITAQSTSPDLRVPDEINSPLVATYHYWKFSDLEATAGSGISPDPLDAASTYHVRSTATELTSIGEALGGGDVQIYVTYDVSDPNIYANAKHYRANGYDPAKETTLVNGVETNTNESAPMYLLRFLHGQPFRQEDGKDGRIANEQLAVYPYNNGDAGLYIYGQEQWQTQLESGANTRGRWPWYIESETLDPYHVYISSRQSQVSSYSYLRTYKPQDYSEIVTGVITRNDNVSLAANNPDAYQRQVPTEYMILGKTGHGLLVTVKPVGGSTKPADEHDYLPTVAARERVVSFEQYWKNNPTANNQLTSRVTANEETVMAEGLTATQISELEALGWHHYKAWANSQPWVRRNDGTTNKKYEYKDHWFQTIDMGYGVSDSEKGEFTLEETSLSAVLVLLDRHGWEIARVNLPNGPDDPTRTEKYAALRKYNSPMVERYHYWKTGSKVPGYHKFTVSDYAVDTDGNEYTSAVLGELDTETGEGSLPDYELQGKVNDMSRDWYVTYDVKPEYELTYTGAATEGQTQATAFMLGQGNGTATKWAQTTDGSTITPADAPADYASLTDNMLWYLRPNFNIDVEMGYLYTGQTGAQDDALTQAETEAQNYSEGRNGFDPYNVQIQSKAYPTRYFTTNATAAAIISGVWQGTGSTAVTLADKANRIAANGHDQTPVKVTNATFMVVDDGNGNMRLMPRFDHTTVLTSTAAPASMSGLAAQTEKEAAGDKVGTQTVLTAHPATYTYHVINKNGREAITYKDAYLDLPATGYTPALPAFLQAYSAVNYKYYPITEFDPDPLTRNVYRLVSAATAHSFAGETFPHFGDAADIYVTYDIDPSRKRTSGLFNLKLRQNTTPTDKYLAYDAADGSVSATATSLTTEETKAQENIWRLVANGGDPYAVSIYNFRQPDTPLGVNAMNTAPTTAENQTWQTFIVTEWDSISNQFELLLANSATDDGTPYAYLTFDAEGNVKVLQSADRQHNSTKASNLVGFTLEPVTLGFTYMLYDLAGNRTLQATVEDVSDLTPSLPAHLRSPLVKEYLYYQDEGQAVSLTSLASTIDNTVYVGYTPYSVEEAPLKLDGSQTYTFHSKQKATTLAMGNNGRISFQTKIGRRQNYYEYTLLGHAINGMYDPYDVAIYSPTQSRYWYSDHVDYTSANREDALNCNSQTPNSKFMILDGATADGINYIQIAQKRVNGSTYYPDLTGTLKYVYNDGTNFSTGQGTSHTDGNANQLHQFQPTHVYHIINLQGKEAVSGVEPRLVKPSVTEPELPTVIQSPLVKAYHYYDITAFNVTADGIYSLKGGAPELTYLSDATTADIYVTYDKGDIDESYNLDGTMVYNIIFGPDLLTQDGITETLNSYFGYNAGLTYRDNTSESNPETRLFQVTGSYYAGPSWGAMESRYIVVNSEAEKTAAIAQHAESGSDESRWNLKYLIEPALTDEQKQSNNYLWSLTGTDPYALQLHNMTDPDKYVYRNSDSGGYTVDLTLGTTTNEQRSTYMLTGRGTGDDMRFNIMATGPCTNDIAPYSYQYIGRSYHNNSHRNRRRGVVLQGFHQWGDWYYIYDEALVTVKLVPQKEGNITYVVINQDGKEAIRLKQHQSLGFMPQLPAAIRSPFAKNYTYYNAYNESTKEFSNEINSDNAATYMVNNATVYVKYDTDDEALATVGLNLDGEDGDGGNSYNLWANGSYFYTNAADNSLVADITPAHYNDVQHEWFLEGGDPYDVRIRSKQAPTLYLQLDTYDPDAYLAPLTLRTDNTANEIRSYILLGGKPGKVELLAATGANTDAAAATPEAIDNRLMYLGFTVEPQILGTGNDAANPVYQSGMNEVQVILRQPLTGVVYHIMNLNGVEAVQYTVAAAKGDVLSVPEPIRSPFATGWQYWSDAACTMQLTEVPSANADIDIYVTYTYDDTTRDQLQLDGQRFYNLKVAGRYVQEEDGAVNALDASTLSTGDANITANLWAYNGQTLSQGIDPYGLHLVNKAYSDIYAGAPLSWVNDTETTVQMSDGETENFRSTFFLAGPSADGPYEMVLCSGPNITDNVLAYVSRHDETAVNLTREADYQHGDQALSVQLTSPVNQYLYKIYDRQGNLAIQAWGDGVAGAAPEVPSVIKSPLVSQFYYDVEALPYTTGKDEVRVTYDVDDEAAHVPNLNGKKLYNLKLRDNHFIKTADGTDVALQTSESTNMSEGGALGESTRDIYIWKPSADMGDGHFDPYAVTLKHSNGNTLYATSLNAGANDIALADDIATTAHQKFILLNGSDGRYQFMAATADKIDISSGNQFAYLGITSSDEAKLLIGNAYAQDRTAIQVELVPFQYAYNYIIVNNSMKEALRIESVTQEAGDAPLLPWEVRSPLIPTDKYKYYLPAAFSTIGDWDTEFGYDDTPTVLTALPYGTTDIYVRYTYTPQPGGLDLSGTVKYQIMHENGTTQNYLYAGSGKGVGNNNNSSANHTTSEYLWKLVAGDDPYDIAIRSMKEYSGVANGYLTDFRPWAYGNHTYEVWTEDQIDGDSNDDFKTHRGNRFAILAHEDGGYRLMTLVPGAWTELNQHWYYTTGTTWQQYRRDNAREGISLQFLPATTHNYRFHLTTHIDERHLIVERPGTMARDLFRLPEELTRKYCTYTVRYYVTDDGDDATRRPVEKGTAGAVEKTIDITSGTELYPYFQYIDNLSDDIEKENTWVDIYVDYDVIAHGETGGIPFNLMTSNRESTLALLDENSRILDEAFDLSSYDKKVEKLYTGLRRCDYLYFMVLKTDNAFTTGNGQYFLRRESSGRISWLNNDFKIYKEQEKNYKKWTYSRCAEAYRENDHDVFQEKNWLWSFAGDPYDLYIFNTSACVEEQYDPILGKTETLNIHRDHLVSYTTLTNKAGTTTEYAVNTPDYTTGAPQKYRWGLAKGQGADSDETFSLITSEFTPTGNKNEYESPATPDGSGRPLYWRMDKSAVEKTNEVMLQTRAENNTTPDYNIQVLPYEPTKFENLRFVLRRDDVIGKTTDDKSKGTYLGNYPVAVADSVSEGLITGAEIAAKSQASTKFIDNLPTGTVRMYADVNDRMFAAGDVIEADDPHSIPLEIQRQFCKYTFYSNDFRNEGNYTVKVGPVRGEEQRDTDGNIIFNEQGAVMYNYYAVDASGNRIIAGYDSEGNPIYQGAPPQTVYAKYTVTTDKFLKKYPTKDEVAEMVANNDHIYFMDFADPNLLKGAEQTYANGHHAYFDSELTFEKQIGKVYEGLSAEKRIWNGSTFVDDTSQPYNFCQYRTTTNRMESVPDRLKWYFVGDPYKLQVYCTQDDFNQNNIQVGGEVQAPYTVGSNLCRFDPTESNFQFVVDCVHLRTPDESILDERETLKYTDSEGNEVEVENSNYGKPYYPNFYWEVVPTTTDDPEAFALRFRADNQLLGYRNVYYYLAHDGIKRTYREARSENPKAYNINLSYDESNSKHLSGKYVGYHAANDENCVIRLKEPTKIYFTVYKETYDGEPVVKEELSEYYGLNEPITEVPRHLQRKYVKYGNLQYQKAKDQTWISTSFAFDLSKDNAYNLQNCNEVDPIHDFAGEWVFQEGTKFDSNGEPVLDSDGRFILEEADYTKSRASFKFRVTYEVDDVTKDDEHLFTTLAEFANENVQPQWLDVKIGNNSWMYYDKMKRDADNIETDTTLVTRYPTSYDMAGTVPAGWDIGIKGLHWAFVGDPYKFTIINRRRWEDLGSPRTALADNNFWLGTGYGQHSTQEDDGSGVKDNLWYNYTKLGDTNENRMYGENGTGGNTDNGNTEWSLMMCKTGGAADYFIRTASPKLTSVDDVLVGDYTSSDPRNMTNDYERLIDKSFTNLDGSAEPATSSFVLQTFSLDTKTQQIAKADIRTAVAEDDDGANNDCFDAIVRIYDQNGRLKATQKHVEVTYGDVVNSLPATLKRLGCKYTECYQLYYSGYTEAMLAAPASSATTAHTAEINAAVQNLNNFTGENKMGSITTFSDVTLNKAKAITDLDGRKYLEIAYVYEVEEDIAQFFTTQDQAQQDDYYWSNTYYQWDQTYKGTNVRVVTYESVFDHYEYNADGHIVNEVYRQVEKVEYKTGEDISTPAYGWLNSHANATSAYADERSQSEDDRQKWSLVGDPYDFEFKNYAEYLNNPKSALNYDSQDGIGFSTTEKSHWAIVQGLQKTAVVNGKTVSVYTDKDGNTVYSATTGGQANTPVYVYYLTLIDDDPASPTYGTAINFVSFDRARDNKDLSADEQYLKLQGAPLSEDATANFYDKATLAVKPFYLKDLMSYANWVIYHLVIAHQHSLDYEDGFTHDIYNNPMTADEADKARRTIDQHFVEWLKYNHPDYMTTASTTVERADGSSATYTKSTEIIKGEHMKSGSNTGVTTGTAMKDLLTGETIATLKPELKKTSLRDIVNDSIADYSVKNVGIGNTLAVPWYMKRQFCNYKLYQRDVLRSETSTRIVYEADGVTPKTFIDENGVEQIAREIDWVSVTEKPTAGYYEDVVRQNGQQIKKLDASHKNRMVIIDVVYEVNPEEFRFAEKGRNTTAWYTMLTQNDKDGLMNFSYKDGVGARHGREEHYTNNYLWAPEGDPYGFIMHSRYATINGTGWDNVVVTTTGQLPTEETIKEKSLMQDSIQLVTLNADLASDVLQKKDNAIDVATYTGSTGNVLFNNKRITHPGRGYDSRRTWGARNAVYEMYAGNWSNSFVMHPTSAYINLTGDTFSSFYMKHNTSDHKAELTYYSTAADIRSDKDANWRMVTTPEQLLPYFDRAGYVGGLQPTVANHYDNIDLYNKLQAYKATYRTNPSVLTDNFRTIDKARELVYGGKFYKRGGSGNPYTAELRYDEVRPTSEDDMPLKFVSNNLVPLQRGYYRIQAFSRKALDADGANLDGTGITGIQGPRYISGYRHKSALDYAGYEDHDGDPATARQLMPGSRWLHFIETDEAHTTLKTYEELNAKIRSLDGSNHYERDIEPHPAMRGNIEILPAEYDPSSIFYFEPADMSGSETDSYDRWNISTQALRLRGRAGGKQGDAPNYGVTKLVDPSAAGYTTGPGKLGDSFHEPTGAEYNDFDDRFRINDIGGTAVTMRLRKYAIGDRDATSTLLDTWDKAVAENLKTNYLCIDANHRYRITIHTDNELKEIGDSYGTTDEDYWQLSDINYGIQDTKWLLQPVGVQTQWPYNQMPLSVRVNAGGQKPNSSDGSGLPGDGNKDNNYYASLYVPFDTRLAKTTDAAFTNVREAPAPYAVQLTSVSQLNNMGNPQFIPAGWPVVIRSSSPVTTITKEDGSTVASAPHVDLYIPNDVPTSIPESYERIHLYGEYLEQTLTEAHITERTNDAAKNAAIRTTIADGRQNVMVLGLPFMQESYKSTWNESGNLGSPAYYAYNEDGAVGFYTNENWHRGYWTDDSELTETASAATADAFALLSQADKGKKEQSHWTTARNATFAQRSNKYVYHNKVYYVHDYDTSEAAPAKPRLVLLFDDEPETPDTPEEPEEPDALNTTDRPWPCDVYDLQGRRVARNETPEGLRRNHPGLPKGVYIFGHKKVIVK